MADAKTTLLTKRQFLRVCRTIPRIKAILAWNADALADARFDRGELTLTIAREQIRAACSTLMAAGYNAFQDVTAVDWFPSSRDSRWSTTPVARVQACAPAQGDGG